MSSTDPLSFDEEATRAEVIEALPRKDGEINLTYYARREFEQHTGLEGVRLTAPWRYHLLHHHIEGYRLYLERSRGPDVSLPQAARIWHRSQYVPTLIEIRRRRLSSSTGGCTTGDVYTDILKAWAEQEGPPVSLREMLDWYDQSLKQSRATWAKRLATSMVDAALPKAIAPLGRPHPAELAALDVEAELQRLQENHRDGADSSTLIAGFQTRRPGDD